MDYNRGSWQNTRTRNGGLTWLPYVIGTTSPVNPTDARTWPDAASEWGGEIHLDADVENAAAFLQDYLTLTPNLTLTPGVRYGRWTGWLTPTDSSSARFLAARHQAFEPRMGVVWDVSGRADLVLKAHWGRYHQSMNAVFFDRTLGGNVYSNQRFYFQGPPLTDSRHVYTPAERDANLSTFTGFSPTYSESILNEAGVVENYRQPYVDQTVLSAEKRFGPRWKLELRYTNRINKDIVGLVDRNLATNYSMLKDVAVKDRVTSETVYDQYGDPLIIPFVWVSNKDLRADLIRRRDTPFRPQPPTPGYTFDDINKLIWEPDIALTTVDGAKRRFDQVSAEVRTEQARWNGFGSLTYTRLRGNIGGLTGFGTTGTQFSAGAAVRPNEATNFFGYLPNFPSFESKVWIGGELLYGFRGGVFGTYSLGNYFAPSFQITPRFRFQASNGAFLRRLAVRRRPRPDAASRRARQQKVPAARKCRSEVGETVYRPLDEMDRHCRLVQCDCIQCNCRAESDDQRPGEHRSDLDLRCTKTKGESTRASARFPGGILEWWCSLTPAGTAQHSYRSPFPTLMPTNRRDFVKASAAIAAVTGARAAFGQPVTGFLPNPPSDSAVDDLALEALNAAQAAGASYADARIGRYRRQSINTREHNVTGVNDSESYGIGVRALV